MFKLGNSQSKWPIAFFSQHFFRTGFRLNSLKVKTWYNFNYSGRIKNKEIANKYTNEVVRQGNLVGMFLFLSDVCEHSNNDC